MLAGGAERYQIVRTLGSGGMGTVYMVEDRTLGREVALKTVRSDDPASTQRFLDEAHVMGQLQHPSILPVYDLGLTAARRPYYTMPVVRGRSLASVLDGLRQDEPALARTYSLAHLVQVFLQVAQAVAYAHAKGVLHRDLKPANVMLGEHGEVQVLDWGVSKLVASSGPGSADEPGLTRSGFVVGTPGYMSPEQARGEPLDARSDVYALGVVLYEMLTLRLPLEEAGTAGQLTSVMDGKPVPPRTRAPSRSIPLELEQACMKALAKSPEERLPTADALQAEVQAWLEVEADRTKRHDRAEAKAAEAREKLEDYRRLKEEVERLAGETEVVAKRFEPWQPIEEKADLTAAEDRAREARQRLVETAADAVGTLELALGFENENGTARGLIADYYWERFLEAERRSENDVEFLRRRVAAYHDGKYARELQGDGSLRLTSEPPGVDVWIHDLVEHGFVVVEKNGRKLGVTPLEETPLALGSYLVVLKKEGYRDTRYPVHITRNRAWKGAVRLLTEAEIGAGLIHVPAGPFVMGGDAEAYTSLPRSEPSLPDFLIAEHPVTMGEYLECLNDVARADGVEAAKKRGSRPALQGPTYLLEDGAGGLKLPDVDAEGDRWDARMPAYGISWHDAVAYCAWRSARDGREYRLPSEEEWEKAARGVDGRWFPWGWRFDPSLCNMRESRRERNAPVAVDEYARDVSVYGVRGLGGNVRDWTSSEEGQGSGPISSRFTQRMPRRLRRVCRGGGWGGAERYSRTAHRGWLEPASVDGGVGFRLARALP